MTVDYLSKQRFDLGRVFERAVGAIGSNGLGLFLVALVIVGTPQALMTWGQTSVQTEGVAVGFVAAVGGWLLSLVCGVLMQGIVTDAVISDLQRRKATLADGFRAALRCFWVLLAIGLLTGLGAMLGLILLIIPGVLLFLMWFVAAPVAVAENAGAFASMERSVKLTQNFRLWTLLLVVIYFVVSLMLGVLIGLIGAVSGGSEVAILVVTALTGAAGSLAYGAVAASLYVELRVVKEGGGKPSIAAIFD